jgi:Enoyl-(Acyl carrier protein) reductase
MLSKIPLGRLGEPQEIAALVAWLASEECSFSTGAVFDLSGGRSTYWTSEFVSIRNLISKSRARSDVRSHVGFAVPRCIEALFEAIGTEVAEVSIGH